MLKILISLFLFFETFLAGTTNTVAPPPPDPSDHATCKMTPAYPPPANRTIPWYQINLDLPPHDRWNEIVEVYMNELWAVIDEIFEHLDWRVINDLLDAIQGHEAEILARYPNGYGEEIQGISDLSGIETAKIILLNAAYELLGVCTSIVAQDTNGNVYHGRNLDFGLGLSFNFTDYQWGLTEVLRNVLFNAEMIKNNQTLYKGTFFAGYVGVLTGVKKQAMTVTVNSRFDDNYDKYLKDWFLNPTDQDQWLTFSTRNALETYNNYPDALNYLSKVSFIGPAYVILGGNEVNQGCVITVGPNSTLLDVWSIPYALPGNNTGITNWYVLETNYDHWNEPPWFDDRRYPAEDCMNEIGSANITLPNLYNVLNGLPNRNRLTTYTALMDCEQGHLESYYQYCTEKDCSPW